MLLIRRSCKIDEGSGGLKWAVWTPDSLHVMSAADFDVRLTVWSLASKAVAYVKHLSKAGRNGIAFSREMFCNRGGEGGRERGKEGERGRERIRHFLVFKRRNRFFFILERLEKIGQGNTRMGLRT